MSRWIEALRLQAQRIAAGNYDHDAGLFEDAPPDIAALSEELNRIANAMIERDRVQQALTHEVHHRVKNSLQIVSSLLNMQVKKLDDPLAKRALGPTRARIGALALIHRLIYEKGEDSAKGQINVAILIAELCTQLRASSRDQAGIFLECEASDLGVPLNDAIPLALLTVEAVTNAFDHAFPDERSGRVDVKFTIEKVRAQLNIKDNGIGFAPNGECASMGRQLMAALAHQLGGSLTIDSSTTTGTMVSLAYPIHD